MTVSFARKAGSKQNKIPQPSPKVFLLGNFLHTEKIFLVG